MGLPVPPCCGNGMSCAANRECYLIIVWVNLFQRKVCIRIMNELETWQKQGCRESSTPKTGSEAVSSRLACSPSSSSGRLHAGHAGSCSTPVSSSFRQYSSYPCASGAGSAAGTGCCADSSWSLAPCLSASAALDLLLNLPLRTDERHFVDTEISIN